MPEPSPALSLRRRAYFALLYFSEGAPIGYIWWALPTRLRAAGMPIDEVTALTALLALPWALKFLWAPAVDALRGPRWGFRAWITLAQFLMGLTLLPLGLMPLPEVLVYAKLILLAHAVSAATQDVAIDALAVASVPKADRGAVNGWMQAGMLVGRGIFGGLALSLERKIGAGNVVLILIGCIWCSLLMLWLVPLPASVRAVTAPRDSAPKQFARALRSLFTRRATYVGFAIALTAGAGFEAVGGMVGPFLIDQGLSKGEVGEFLAFPVIAAMVLGALLGGQAADRVGHRAMVRFSILAILACVALIVHGDSTLRLHDERHVQLTVLPLYLFIGSLTASSYALFMDLTDPALAGTQFSAFMGATNLCEIWAVASAGRIARQAGYAPAFATLAIASLAALLFLPLLPSRPSKAEDSEVEPPA